ncbi:hypothetical protein SAMN04488112_10951 [Melghirimyces thermohalophilus]|uniref:Cytochrome c domain-containing protein n=1 Tax=Melghirimyces thermohalophilus TaxID=1236220 RepID=A0A1G6M8D1_9BACL|nr:electron transport protein [Melghirimyces thermohalophilus]SDC51564.1 hypothetical protein SAMN04488112_10951 [Melghirimyces thermohalophilus]
MKRRTIWMIVLGLAFAGVLSVYFLEPEMAYMPATDKVLNRPDSSEQETTYYDLNGKTLSAKEGKQHPEAVAVTPSLIKSGRETFYKETFGNEVFLTDIVGLVDGPLTIPKIMKAILQLKGKGTDNLQVELAQTVTLGGKTYRKGSKIDTGIDVPKGSFMPLGMPVKFREGQLKVGVSCAACHATVDRQTKKVVEGAANSNLNQGLLLAMGTNSAAYFTHTQLTPRQLAGLKRYLDDPKQSLPEPKAIEKQVDQVFSKWPRGSFDSTIDLKSNPTKIPDSFTFGAHPYGWSGFASTGPFHGLSVFSNNVHAQNSDTLTQADASPALFGIPKEAYLGTILQNAAHPRFRYRPEDGKKPSQFFASVDPTPGTPGVNEVVVPPTFPKSTPVAPAGVLISSPGTKVGQQNNAMAAWQNTLVPPKAPVTLDEKKVERGRKVFRRAGCIRCHAGGAFTRNRIIPADIVKTEPSRAQALKKTGNRFGPPILYRPDTPVPPPKGARTLKVPYDSKKVRLGFAHGDSPGGYKTPSLKGLYWRAPYLHDGGVAVGLRQEKGVTGTLLKGIQPDPFKSLTALLDKDIRQQVIQANQDSPDLRSLHIQGIGHEYWVDDNTGFSKEEQQALVHYLLSLPEKK